MCGIAGNLNFSSGPITKKRINRVLKSMYHRGPDSSGFFQTSIGNCYLSLMHTRLSIIDKDASSNQPFISNNCVLIFNGEIFNYIELKKELKNKGFIFKTQSDTEVVIKSYVAWGVECVDRFEGMWSFALYNIEKKQLILSRDRLGEKPLFIFSSLKTYSFASEISALSLLLNGPLYPNNDSIKSLLVNGYKSIYKQDGTFFKGVREIPPASNIIINVNSNSYNVSEAKKYWDLKYKPHKREENETHAILKERLISAVKIRMRSDVPLAFCLSGGVDSSTIAAIACKILNHNISTFSIIDNDSRYNEKDEIDRNVESLESKHFFIKTDKSNFIEKLEKQIAYRNAPVFTLSYFMHAQISEYMNKKGFKVSVSGTGADELFTGYYDHYNFWLADMFKEEKFKDLVDDWKKGYGKNVRNDYLKDPLCFIKNPRNRDHIYPNRSIFNNFLYSPLEKKILEHNFSSNLLRNRMMNELFQEFVPVALHEDDFNSMTFSVENRSPFLDSKLIEFAYSIPNQLLVKNGMLKWPLRALGEGIVPDKIRFNKIKRGFNASIMSLIDLDNPNTKERLLSESPIFDLIKRDSIESFINTNNFSDNENSKFLFNFISTKLFLEQPLFSNREPH